MNPKFRINVDEINSENSNDFETTKKEKDIQNYQHDSTVRNISFVLLNGNQKFLNYGYLVSCEYLHDDNKIVLTFTSDIITIKGKELLKLYYLLMAHRPRELVAINERYSQLSEDEEILITEIEVRKHE